MDWNSNSKLKRNQFAAACQIDYFLKTEWDKDILTATHSIGQLLNYHVKRKTTFND